MKLNEAVASLSIQLEVKRRLGKNREADAIGLGIEALMYVKDVRHIINTPNPELLPSETKD